MTETIDLIKLGEKYKAENIERYNVLKARLQKEFDQSQTMLDREIAEQKAKLVTSPLQKLANSINSIGYRTVNVSVHKELALCFVDKGDPTKQPIIGTSTFREIRNAGYKIDYMGGNSTPTKTFLYLTKV